jgi:beta-glucosidase
MRGIGECIEVAEDVKLSGPLAAAVDKHEASTRQVSFDIISAGGNGAGMNQPWAIPLAILLAAATSQAQDARFINPAPAADIYKNGWIDLNKNGTKDPYEDPAVDTEQRITDLLSRMTMEEKTAQMVTLYGFPRVAKDELPTEAWKQSMWKDGIGNIDEHINGNQGWTDNLVDPKYDLPYSLHARAINEVQRWFVEQTRLGVPVDFTDEGIRGLLHSKATSFPAQLAQACAWDAPLVREIGRITGAEARALGYTNVYSPIADLPRDPRWGRTIESYSEDPFLTGELVKGAVEGIQSQRVASTLKHFAIYSIPKGGRDGEARTDPQASWREVETIYLEPFRKGIRDAGALGVMASYNDYDGIPIEANEKFLTDILRHEWGFRGYVVSDSGAVEFVYSKHRVASSPAEAIRQSVQAGLNVRTNFTPPEAYVEPLRALVREGKLSMETIDSRVRDVLRVKYWLGLFDQPYRQTPGDADQTVRAPDHLAAAARMGRESIVLLRNEGNILPLRKDVKKVLVAGPLADHRRAWWSRYGPQRLTFTTILDGIRNELGSGVEVKYVQGCNVADGFPQSEVYKEPPSDAIKAQIAEAVAAAADVDVIIAALGETDELCRESVSRISLNLPGYQEELLQALHATGKPLVLVLTNGRPLSINWAAQHVNGIVEAFFQGEDGGNAIADVLFGDYNPAGRLPVTVPRSVGQIPLNFPAHPGSQARDNGQVFGPLYPFGYGLSYTSFTYSNLNITPQQQGPGGEIQVSIDVTNSGARDGDEVVQLYVRDDYSSVIGFEKMLRGFERIHLRSGQTQTVHFTLKPEHLQLYNRNNQWVVEPGRFTVMLGASSEDIRQRGIFDIVDSTGKIESSAGATDRTDPR